MPKRLTKNAIQAVRDNADLYSSLCDVLEVKPASLPVILARNSNNINRYDVVELIANYMGIDPAEAVEEYEADPVSA